MRLCVYLCLSVCLSARLLKKLWTDFYGFLEVWGKWPEDQSVTFWWRSISQSGSGILHRIGSMNIFRGFFLFYYCIFFRHPRIKRENPWRRFELSECFLVILLYLRDKYFKCHLFVPCECLIMCKVTYPADLLMVRWSREEGVAEVEKSPYLPVWGTRAHVTSVYKSAYVNRMQ